MNQKPHATEGFPMDLESTAPTIRFTDDFKPTVREIQIIAVNVGHECNIFSKQPNGVGVALLCSIRPDGIHLHDFAGASGISVDEDDQLKVFDHDGNEMVPRIAGGENRSEQAIATEKAATDANAELLTTLEEARRAIAFIPEKTLGTHREPDGSRWPYRDELLHRINLAIARAKGGAA